MIEATPLETLSRLLCRAAAPISIAALLTHMEETDEYLVLKKMVEDLLPQHKEEILAAGSAPEMVGAFAFAFERAYFPLGYAMELGEVEGLSELTRGIPLELQGMDYDEYHELPSTRMGFMLASLLVDFEEELGLNGDGIRATVLEAVTSDDKGVPQALLKRLPKQGYAFDFLKETLPDSPYEGLLAHARYLCHATDSHFLDATYEDGWESPDWDRETVEALTEQWHRCEDIRGLQFSFIDWLEEDPARHLSEVITFLNHGWKRRLERKAGQLDMPGIETEPVTLVRMFASEESQPLVALEPEVEEEEPLDDS